MHNLLKPWVLVVHLHHRQTAKVNLTWDNQLSRLPTSTRIPATLLPTSTRLPATSLPPTSTRLPATSLLPTSTRQTVRSTRLLTTPLRLPTVLLPTETTIRQLVLRAFRVPPRHLKPAKEHQQVPPMVHLVTRPPVMLTRQVNRPVSREVHFLCQRENAFLTFKS